jgi:hypothetical protein
MQIARIGDSLESSAPPGNRVVEHVSELKIAS